MADENLLQIYATNPVTTLADDDLIYVQTDNTTTPDAGAMEKADLFAQIHNGGWIEVSESWTYASATTINVPAGATSRFQKGWGVRFKQGGAYKYGVFGTVASELLTLIGNTDYSVANSAITDIAISPNPNNAFGFSVWFNYTISWAASGSMTFTSVTTNYGKWKIVDSKTIRAIGNGAGTTGGTASNTITASMPIAATLAAYLPTGVAYVGDGGSAMSSFCFVTTVVNCRKTDSSNFGLGATRFVNFDASYGF